MQPDEVRALDNQYALLFVRGERPLKDLKYDILKHPNVKLTTDGSAKPYMHGQDNRSIASVVFDPALMEAAGGYEIGSHNYVLLSEEEIDEIIPKNNQEENNNENH